MPEKSVSDPTDLRRNSTTSVIENCVKHWQTQTVESSNERIIKTKEQRSTTFPVLFFSLTPSRTVISTDNLAGTLSAEHYPINYYRVTYGVVGISLSRKKGRKDGKKGRKREKNERTKTRERKKRRRRNTPKGTFDLKRPFSFRPQHPLTTEPWNDADIEIGKVNAFAICSYQNLFRLFDHRLEASQREWTISRAIVTYKS